MPQKSIWVLLLLMLHICVNMGTTIARKRSTYYVAFVEGFACLPVQPDRFFPNFRDRQILFSSGMSCDGL